MKNVVIAHMLGIIRPVDPREWPETVRRLRRADGWMPPMMLIATVFVLFFVERGFGLFGGNNELKVFNYVALATWLVVAVFSTLAVMIDGVNNLRRLGMWALLRPRWWFELSRLAWIGLLLAALSMLLFQFAGGPRLHDAGEMLSRALPTLFFAFMLFSTGGYLVSLMTTRRRRGRAFECVQWFYWLVILIGTATTVPLWFPDHVQWMTVVACVLAACLMAILLLAITDRWKRRAAG